MITDFVTWFQHRFAFHGHAWTVEVLLMLLLTFVIATIIKIIYAALKSRIVDNERRWRTIFLRSTEKPFLYLVWLLGLTLIGDVFGVSAHQNFLFPVDQYIRKIGFVILLVWGLMRFVNEGELYYLSHKKRKVDKTTVDAIAKILKATIVVTGILALLESMGVGISGVLAFGGVSGAAIAFAAKDLLANFFGGLIIYLDRPFAVGDNIRSPDRNIEGTVEQIGWRLCRIRTADKSPLYVPNSLFTMITLENTSRRPSRHLKTTIGLRYQDAPKLPNILENLENMLRHHADIDLKSRLIVNFAGFGASSLDILIDCYIKATDQLAFQKIQQDIFFKMIEIISSYQADFAYPSTTVYVPDGIDLRNSQ